MKCYFPKQIWNQILKLKKSTKEYETKSILLRTCAERQLTNLKLGPQSYYELSRSANCQIPNLVSHLTTNLREATADQPQTGSPFLLRTFAKRQLTNFKLSSPSYNEVARSAR